MGRPRRRLFVVALLRSVSRPVLSPARHWAAEVMYASVSLISLRYWTSLGKLVRHEISLPAMASVDSWGNGPCRVHSYLVVRALGRDENRGKSI